ncbi:MAG: hypothetical protein J5585_08380 [Clostridia bacterium]|nr:hypothetical protein [Clostridia bacterium]
MDKIRYILDLSNLTAPDEAADALRRRAEDASSKLKKRRAAKKAVLIAVAVIAVAAAVTAAVLAVSRSAKKHGERIIFGFSLQAPEVFLYTAAHTRVTEYGEVIVKDGFLKGYENFFGTSGDEIAPSLYRGATKIIPGSSAVLYGRTDVSGPGWLLEELPEDVQTIIIAAAKYGTFDCFLTVDVIVKETGSNRNGPVYTLYSPDGKKTGRAEYDDKTHRFSPLTFDSSYDLIRSARVYETRYEYDMPVIYGVYGADPDTAVFRKNDSGETDEIRLDLCGGPAKTMYFYPYYYDILRYSEGMLHGFRDVTLDTKNPYFDNVTRRIIEELDLQWFMPMFEFFAGEDQTVYVGDALRLSDTQPLASSIGPWLSRYGSEQPFDFGYYYYACEPYFKEDFCDNDVFTAVCFKNGEIEDVRTVTLDELQSMLRDSGREALPDGIYTASYPVLKGGHFEDGEFIFPFSRGRLSFLPDGVPGEYCTLFDRLGLKAPNPERVTGTKTVYVVYDSKKEPQPEVEPFVVPYNAGGMTVTVTDSTVTTLTGHNGAEYTLTAVTGYRVVGNYVCDLDGVIIGLRTNSGCIPFDHRGAGADELLVVSDAGGEVLYVTSGGLEQVNGVYPFETLDCGVSLEMAHAITAGFQLDDIFIVNYEEKDGALEVVFWTPKDLYPAMPYPLILGDGSAVRTDFSSGARLLTQKNGRCSVSGTEAYAAGDVKTYNGRLWTELFEYDGETKTLHQTDPLDD